MDTDGLLLMLRKSCGRAAIVAVSVVRQDAHTMLVACEDGERLLLSRCVPAAALSGSMAVWLLVPDLRGRRA